MYLEGRGSPSLRLIFHSRQTRGARRQISLFSPFGFRAFPLQARCRHVHRSAPLLQVHWMIFERNAPLVSLIFVRVQTIPAINIMSTELLSSCLALILP